MSAATSADDIVVVLGRYGEGRGSEEEKRSGRACTCLRGLESSELYIIATGLYTSLE